MKLIPHHPEYPESSTITECCTLEYQPHAANVLLDEARYTLAQVYRCASGTLDIHVESDWKAFVDREDVDEVEELLADFSARNDSDPGGLWAQLIQTNWGIVVTGTVQRYVHDQVGTETLPGNSTFRP